MAVIVDKSAESRRAATEGRSAVNTLAVTVDKSAANKLAAAVSTSAESKLAVNILPDKRDGDADEPERNSSVASTRCATNGWNRTNDRWNDCGIPHQQEPQKQQTSHPEQPSGSVCESEYS